MKNLIAASLAALATGFIAPAMAADGHDSHEHEALRAPAAAEAPLTEGIVKKVDKSVGKVTISHGPLPNGMPAMTMVFRVKEAAWIEKMREGQKIRFAAGQIDGAMTLLKFEPAKG